MQKVFFLLMLTWGLLQADEYTKQDRIEDMNKMAQAMNIIQSGFFYNNYKTVEAGVEMLTQTVINVRAPQEERDETDIMTKYMDRKFQMTGKIIRKINKKSVDILDRFKTGDSAQALQAYSKIMGQCMKCHREIRNW